MATERLPLITVFAGPNGSGKYRVWSTSFWSAEQIGKLTGIETHNSDFFVADADK